MYLAIDLTVNDENKIKVMIKFRDVTQGNTSNALAQEFKHYQSIFWPFVFATIAFTGGAGQPYLPTAYVHEYDMVGNQQYECSL